MEQEYERVLTALCLWREARGECLEAKRGVWWVLRNRIADSRRWGNRFSDVILQPYQFSAFNQSDPNAAKWPAWDDHAWRECCEIVESPGVDDPTLGANHYHSIPENRPWPPWAHRLRMTAVIGSFRFFKL